MSTIWDKFLRNFDLDYISTAPLTLLHKSYLRFYLSSWLLWIEIKYDLLLGLLANIDHHFSPHWPDLELPILPCTCGLSAVSRDGQFILPRWLVVIIKKGHSDNVLLEDTLPSKNSHFCNFYQLSLLIFKIGILYNICFIYLSLSVFNGI